MVYEKIGTLIFAYRCNYMLRKISLYLGLSLTLVGALSSCDKDTKSVNIFSISDDKQLGNQLEQEILSDPATYPILDEAKYPVAYQNLNRVVNSLLGVPSINHKNDFDWKARIVKDDNTLNAFAGPGGKIFVYTGIIKYLEAEDEFAGVVGHEICHADRRHITDQMTKAYGLQLLLDVVVGKNPGMLTQIAAGLVTLKFSRTAEAEADEYGVIYLYESSEKYDPRGVGKFFQKLIDQGQAGSTPQFLSDHPSPENRVEAINKKWKELGGEPGQTYADRYKDFKNSLP